MIASNNNSIFMFGYCEQHLPEAELENEADLYFYQWANYLTDLLANKTSQEVELLIIHGG